MIDIQQPKQLHPRPWIALSIGNSRSHWAWFLGESLQEVWQTPHRIATAIAPTNDIWDGQMPPGLARWVGAPDQLAEIWLVSVVPEQTVLWQSHPGVKMITLDQIPLQATYPTLGVDRALAVWRAGEIWDWPILVIDAGTALTFTGADADHRLVGGAILPGLGLQVRSLAHSTAALPFIELANRLPNRWATNTSEAVESGIIYTALAGIGNFVQAWCQEFSESRIVLTGGDHLNLLNYLKAWSTQASQAPEAISRMISEPHLVFSGIQSLRQKLSASTHQI